MFVNKSDLIEVVLYYSKSEKGTNIKVTSKIETVPEDKRKNYLKVCFKMRPTDWKIYNDLQRESLVDKGTGNGEQIDWIKYKELKLLKLIADWDAKDKEGNKIPIKPETIFSLHPFIAENLLGEYDKNSLFGEA